MYEYFGKFDLILMELCCSSSSVWSLVLGLIIFQFVLILIGSIVLGTLFLNDFWS